MKRIALPLMAAMLLPFATTASGGELDTLHQRCAEQERQIRELEAENNRLRAQLSGDAETTALPVVSGSAGPAVKEQEERPPSGTVAPGGTDSKSPSGASEEPPKATIAPHSTATTHTVKAGETLTKIARRYNTTPESITKANRIKDPSVVRVGSKLIIPSTSKPAVATTEAPPAAAGSHTIAERETLYGIARKHGTTVQAIIEANPGIDPSNLRIGHTLKLPSKSAGPGTTAGKEDAGPAGSGKSASGSPPPKMAAGTDAKPDETSNPESVAKKDDSASKETEPAQEPEESSTAESGIHKVTVDEQTTFGEFASKHGTTPEKLNSLNGLTLSTSTVLAKGSELYVPGGKP